MVCSVRDEKAFVPNINGRGRSRSHTHLCCHALHLLIATGLDARGSLPLRPLTACCLELPAALTVVSLGWSASYLI